MRSTLFCFILSFVFGYQNSFGQCDFITPPAVKKISDASREVTFSNVTMNGKETTYLAVKKGAAVNITTRLESKKDGNYCPGCIVQIYWGIRGHTSVCANSFYGYHFKSKKSSHQFSAPMEDGIYYITMGSTLDYSCKNNINRPKCSPDNAFAVLKVGNPDPEKKATLVKVKKGSGVFLKTTLAKSGCFGDLDKIEWFLEGQKLAYENQQEIPITQSGTYKVLWSNCLESVAKSLNYTSNGEEVKTFKLNTVSTPRDGEEESEVKTVTLSTVSTPRDDEEEIEGAEDTEVQTVSLKTVSTLPDDTDIAVLIENSDKFLLENLIFDLGKSDIKPEAEKDLNKLAEIMKDNPSMKILLEGHTDRIGSARKNLVLSESRVKSTKEYLVKQGVMNSNIDVKGWGHQKPLVVTKDREEGKINRRVEIRILSR